MGVYSMDRHQATNIPVVEADERYFGSVGAQRILAECCQNDLAFFEGVIAGDFKTAVGIKEGTILESEMQAIAEGTVSGFFSKIKELVKKVWAKIKGLFKNFFIKINALCTGDNKKLVEKYKKEVLKKDLSKMKFKYAKRRTGNDISVKELEAAVVDSKAGIKAGDEDDIKERWLGRSLGGGKAVTAEDYTKEAHEYLFEDEDEFEGLSAAGISIGGVMANLVNSGNTIKNAKKAEDELDKVYRNIIKDLEKKENELIKNIPDDKSKEADLAQLHDLQRYVNTANTVATMASNAIMAGIKFGIAQDRRLWVKAATFNPSSVKEDAIYVEACCEVSDEEIETAIAKAPTAAEKEAYDDAARDGKLDPTGDVGPQDGSI